MAMAPKFHAKMGIKIEQEMLIREANWLENGGYLAESEAESDYSTGPVGQSHTVKPNFVRNRPNGSSPSSSRSSSYSEPKRGRGRPKSSSASSSHSNEEPKRGRGRTKGSSPSSSHSSYSEPKRGRGRPKGSSPSSNRSSSNNTAFAAEETISSGLSNATGI